MSILAGPTVRGDGSGNAVLIKHAVGTGRLRLRHEAQVLAAAHTAHVEGVVESVGFDELDDRCELRLRYIEAVTLAERPPLQPFDVLDVLIDVGTTLAQLHTHGIRHGALRDDHVLLVPPRRPVLCGFGEATGPNDQTQHRVGSDLAALAALGASELARANESATAAAEQRACADAMVAVQHLAIAAETATDHDGPLTDWLARMRHVRDSAQTSTPTAAGEFATAQPSAEPFAPDPDDLRERLRAQVTASDSPHVQASPSPGADLGKPSESKRRRLALLLAMAATLAATGFIAWSALTNGGASVEVSHGSIVVPAAQGTADPLARVDISSTDTGADGAVNAGSSHNTNRGPADSAFPVDADDVPVLTDSATANPAAKSPTVVNSPGATLLYGTQNSSSSRSASECSDPDSIDAGDASITPATTDSPDADSPDIGAADTDEKDTGTDADGATVIVHHVDIRADGCPMAVRIEMPGPQGSAAQVSSSDGRWTLGSAGDLVAVGDWGCEGRSTLAVVSPTTGIVGFFSSWPRTGYPILPTRFAYVPLDATGVSVNDSANTPVTADSPSSGDSTSQHFAPACDELIVHYGELRVTVVQREPGVDAASWLHMR